MKKIFKIILICLLIFIVAFILWKSDVFVSDHSADISSERVIWNGKEYYPVSGDYTEGKMLSKNGDWVINSVEEDPTHTFIVARSFSDDYLMVCDDYNIPETGELTTVSWNGTYISDPLFLEAISKIEAEKTTMFSYQTDGIFQLTDNQHMRSLYFAYDNCPVTTNYKGYMGKVNGEWVITTHIPQDTTNIDGSPKTYSVDCYKIPDKYNEILSFYFT